MSIRDRAFDRLASLVSRSPWIVLGVALLVTIAAGAASESLKMETRILDLVPREDPASIEFNDIVRQYSSASQIMIAGVFCPRMLVAISDINRLRLAAITGGGTVATNAAPYAAAAARAWLAARSAWAAVAAIHAT